MGPALDGPLELKAFRSRGLVRRVTPFIGAGLIALVVFTDPNFSRLPWADALAVLVAAAATAAAFVPVDWNGRRRLTMAAPLLLGLYLALGAASTQGSTTPLAAAAAGTLVIIAIYGVPWDSAPRWAHNLPVFGGIVAVFVIQATAQASGFAVATVLLVFPLYLTTVLFAALHLRRNEVWAAAALASVGILASAMSTRNQPGEPALALLVIAVLWMVVLTVHAVVRRSLGAEERIRLLIASLKDYAILTMDPRGNVTSWNQGAEQIKGYTEDEIIGRNFSCFYPKEDVEAGKPGAALAEAARLGRSEDEGWRVKKDGTRFWAEVVVTALQDESGQLHGFGTFTRDVTERKRIENALADSKARLQAIVDTALTAIVTMDGHGVITGWNPRAEAIFGWSQDEVLGNPLAETIIPTQHRAAHRAGLARYLATGEGPVLGKVLELSALDRGGREFPVELAISPATAPGGSPLFVGFVRDISARKQAADAIANLNSELKIANQHKSEFLANMSHELRTPLNSILGFSELLLDDTSARYDASTHQKFLSQINTSGRHLLALISDILDLSKVEAGRMTLKLESFSVSDVVGDVLATIEPIATKKRIAIKADVAAAGKLEADAGKFKQMLLNLASNAVKFTPEGGMVSMDARRLPEGVEIAVTDTGIGIAQSDIDRLFKEFQQLDSGPGRRQEGTGLGLALTKRLARLHGGDVRVVSEVGKGSTFTISLPLRPTPSRQLAPPAVSAPPAS
ncbi:MAG: PAS domain-containing sensor histidine kinase [Chloroflexi bacterium]|nr:MAG: PAS domain-containing sensor histidine kinase [Chloroflexota bacterium]TMG23875.1 MAG: PAS domain-containing sensor histidine kinase [Chloroflexota bacterium]